MKTAKEILLNMKEVLEYYLEELNGMEDNQFAYGEKTAYVECLEMIQDGDKENIFGLDYNIEKRYPI
ncbi:MAG: hypothetical protein DBX59_09565 [Bacillota bacterium]|nr:MAG: hypothetical protein DBX59_09565 [Bacillota bacterium]